MGNKAFDLEEYLERLDFTSAVKPTEDRLNAIERFSFALKRCGRMRAAIDLWTEAARSGQIYAHVELAKFYEHTQQDHHTAAHWTETAIELLHAPGSPSHIRERWLADLEHRLARLRRKQARQ